MSRSLHAGRISKAVATLCLAILADAAVAQPNTDWTTVNLAVTDAHVLPLYDAFASATAGLADVATGFCASPSAEGLAELRTNYHTAMDGWQRVQHLQFGPITYFNWNYRVQYWPDDRGTGARQVEALLAARDPAVLEDDAFDRQSVGVQGFQALELLLFDDGSLRALQDDAYRCSVVQAISANLHEIADGVVERWRGEFREIVVNADQRGFFESAEDATIDFMKALVEPVRRIKEQKLDAVLGANLAAARERRAESWRADRSLRNITLNVQALAQLFSVSEPPLSSVLQDADVTIIDAELADLLAQLEAQPDALGEALSDEAGHSALLQVAAQLEVVYEAMEAALKNTDLYLGFNSLDGD